MKTHCQLQRGVGEACPQVCPRTEAAPPGSDPWPSWSGGLFPGANHLPKDLHLQGAVLRGSPSLACSTPEEASGWPWWKTNCWTKMGLGLILQGRSYILWDPSEFPFQNVCKNPGQRKTILLIREGLLLVRHELCSPVLCRWRPSNV